MQSHTVCGSKLRLYVVAVEEHTVIARLRHLVGVYEARGVREVLERVYLVVDHMGAHCRHEKYVTVIGTPGAVEVGVRETVDK